MITVEGLTKHFGTLAAVDQIDFNVADGEICALVGTSGCGKSTTIKLINRLIEPTGGRVLVAGVDTRTVAPSRLRLDMGYVIQGVGLFPHWTVAENIATVPRLLGWDAVRIERRVETLLELFHLDPALFADKYPHQLSGGQQQRVGVARAIAAEPKVLLMDEPFGALDPITRLHLQDEFLALQKRHGITVVIVTHDMDEAFKLADRIAVMHQGRILQFDEPEALIRRPEHAFVRDLVGTQDSAFRLLSLVPVRKLASKPEPGRWVRNEEGSLIDTRTGRPVDGVNRSETAREAASKLVWHHVDVIPVLDSAGEVSGQISLNALRAAGRGIEA